MRANYQKNRQESGERKKKIDDELVRKGPASKKIDELQRSRFQAKAKASLLIIFNLRSFLSSKAYFKKAFCFQ